MAGIKGGAVGSIKDLKRSLKKKSGTFIKYVPSESSLLVRFATEPDEWVQFFEHYDDLAKQSYPCSDDCRGCDAGDRPKKRYLANAIDVDESKIVPLSMPTTLASAVLKGYEKYNTVMDRDYDLSRTGSGFDTEYSAFPEAPTKRNLAKYDLLDLMAILEGLLSKDDDDEDDEEDEAPARRSSGRVAKKSAPARRRSVPDDEDEDTDEDDERPARRLAKKRPVKKPIKRTLQRR